LSHEARWAFLFIIYLFNFDSSECS
jgi:hypothetical protein